MKQPLHRDKPQSETKHPQVGPGAYIAPHVELGADVEIGPNAVILAQDAGSGSPTTIESGVVIGANATVLPGVVVGFGARVGPGSVVARSVPPLAIVEGNPALIVGYVNAGQAPSDAAASDPASEVPQASRVRGVTLHRFRTASDMRGRLSVTEFQRDTPFQPVRCFIVHGVPSAETRGEHAHRRCHQLLIAASGSIRVMVDDGEAREEFILDSPTKGLFLPAMTWAVQYGYLPGAVLVVLASEHYDQDDYIRDYGEFVALARRSRST